MQMKLPTNAAKEGNMLWFFTDNLMLIGKLITDYHVAKKAEKSTGGFIDTFWIIYTGVSLSGLNKLYHN